MPCGKDSATVVCIHWKRLSPVPTDFSNFPLYPLNFCSLFINQPNYLSLLRGLVPGFQLNPISAVPAWKFVALKCSAGSHEKPQLVSPRIVQIRPQTTSWRRVEVPHWFVSISPVYTQLPHLPRNYRATRFSSSSMFKHVSDMDCTANQPKLTSPTQLCSIPWSLVAIKNYEIFFR